MAMAQNQMIPLEKSYSSSNVNIHTVLKELRPMDYIKYFAMFIAWINICILKAFMELISSSTLSMWSQNAACSEKCAGDLMFYGEIGQDRGASSSNLAIGRLLSHILRILSEVPATSKKYDLLLSTADKIINDNLQHHNTSLHDATRNVLSSAFSVTCKLLRRSLHKSKSSQVNNRTSRLLCLLPFGLHLATGFETIRACINSLANDARHDRSYGIVRGAGSCSDELPAAEKLANELLWIVNKMRLCSMSREVIVTWGYESSLASLVVDAHPRVQGPIVQIFAMLLDDLTSGEWEAQRVVKYRMIRTWLPTLCYAGNGVTSHVVTRGEKQQMERRIEALIYSLPYEDQEVILRGWVEDFARSDSDWPDVGKCFDSWCQNSRKFLF